MIKTATAPCENVGASLRATRGGAALKSIAAYANFSTAIEGARGRSLTYTFELQKRPTTLYVTLNSRDRRTDGQLHYYGKQLLGPYLNIDIS